MRLLTLTLALAAVGVACGGSASPVGPLPSMSTPARLDRVVESGGGGGTQCGPPGPCESGLLRVDAGDADFWGSTDITQRATGAHSFVATSDLIELAGHVTGEDATLDVTNGIMSASLTLIARDGGRLEIGGQSKAVHTQETNPACALDIQLVTEATFVFRYIGRTVITETHCIQS